MYPKLSAKYQRSVGDMLNNSFPLKYSTLMLWRLGRLPQFTGFVTSDVIVIPLSLFLTCAIHEADNEGLIQSTWFCYWMAPFLTVAYNGKHYILVLSLRVGPNCARFLVQHYNSFFTRLLCSFLTRLKLIRCCTKNVVKLDPGLINSLSLLSLF